jgi:Nucleoside 2-deoxyribosyltransferase
MKIYLGGAMFTLADVTHNLNLAKLLREKDFVVYCPNENADINDKTKSDITGKRIYQADLKELESANVFLCQVSEDSGTMWEAGYMDCLSKKVDSEFYWGVIGLATDIRLRTTPNPLQANVDNQSFYINQFIVGGLKCSLGIYLDIQSLIQQLEKIRITKII